MLPLILSPVLGNPVSLAAVGVNRSQSLPEQVSASSLSSNGALVCSSCFQSCSVVGSRPLCSGSLCLPCKHRP